MQWNLKSEILHSLLHFVRNDRIVKFAGMRDYGLPRFLRNLTMTKSLNLKDSILKGDCGHCGFCFDYKFNKTTAQTTITIPI
ncbi:hypothetical protein [Helicobacter sp. UBA3407]|uniref:hypothetical protein n=1 Tax=Helicobacter TaxID=209 RepID=UPI002628B9A4|nr:hypothetical protein [Helicobacter sp. UBA3407]